MNPVQVSFELKGAKKRQPKRIEVTIPVEVVFLDGVVSEIQVGEVLPVDGDRATWDCQREKWVSNSLYWAENVAAIEAVVDALSREES